MELTPTLWRTGRVLAGPTRLELLGRIIASPNQCVGELAEATGLAETRASQELRRLQARGLVQAVRSGRWVRYRPVPDPKVPSAKPLLEAMKAALARHPSEGDAQTIPVAKAFSHERRLKMLRWLENGPCGGEELRFMAGLSKPALFRHLQVLKRGGLVRRTKNGWEWTPNPHPLAKAMRSLLAD